MDLLPDDALRVAFSFNAGTFDLRRICPEWYFETDDGRCTAVRLDHRWERLFGSLRELGMVLASTSSGPLTLKDTWLQPAFLRLPESDVLLDVESGCEVRLSALNSALAIVEDVGDQQLASLHFLDSTGRGMLKILLTSGSDLTAFEQLVMAHSFTPFHAKDRHLASPLHSARCSGKPDAASVRALWSGLSRTTPGDFFPGLEGISRHAALSAAGADLAWLVSVDAVQEAVQQAVLHRLTLGGAVRNSAVILPAAFRPSQSESFHGRTTWFSDLGQFTLCAHHSLCRTWAVRHSTAIGDVVCLEFYDAEDRFCGGLGLRPEANAQDQHHWKHALRGV